MVETRKITISTETLSGAIRGLNKEQAERIIDATNKAIVDGRLPVKTNLTGKSIILEEPPGLPDRCIIVLATSQDQMIAVLGYDPKTGRLATASEQEEHVDELPSKTDVISAIDKAAATIANAVTRAGGRGRDKGT